MTMNDVPQMARLGGISINPIAVPVPVAEAPAPNTATATTLNSPADEEIELTQVDAAGLGDVDYVFEIGAFEVTNAEYAAFLNAVASQGDPNSLFDSMMTYGIDGGISRFRVGLQPSTFRYLAKPHMADKPVNYVTWFDAARFVNWLENGQPRGPQGPGTTETGSYDLTGGDGTYVSVQRSAEARWILPSWTEWRKAAFHDPIRRVQPSFWSYSTQSNDPPQSSPATDDGHIMIPGDNVVNYGSEANWNGSISGNVVTVGSAGPASAYGAFDMNGNVAEWTEQVVCVSGICGRNVVGGSYESQLSEDGEISGLLICFAPIHGAGGETYSAGSVGFRVARLSQD